MKSGNLNFLEPSGPLQAGNGTDCFTFYLYVLKIIALGSTQPLTEISTKYISWGLKAAGA
jgi:hypothetical protein